VQRSDCTEFATSAMAIGPAIKSDLEVPTLIPHLTAGASVYRGRRYTPTYYRGDALESYGVDVPEASEYWDSLLDECGGVCAPDELCCSGQCRNPANDPINCGGCGNACTGGKICLDGACKCPIGQTECNGACRDLSSNPSACGDCAVSCTGGSLCCGGVCKDVQTDAENCGSCGTVCPQSCSGERRCKNGN